LLLIYVRRLRHPAALLSAAVLLLAAGAVYPEPAALAAQAGVLGLALALLAAILARGVVHERPQPAAAEKAGPVVVAAGSSAPRRPSTDGSTPTQDLPAVSLPSPPDPTP
jgi:hypothetical protein